MYIKYNLERHLKKICEESPEYMDLYASWEISKKTYSKMLSTILYNYPTYSMHDGSHSEKIVSSIEMLLGEDRITLLGPTETWMILQCAYLHDLGMILPDSLIRKTLSEDDFEKELKSYLESDDENIREAAEYIRNIRETEGNLWILDSRKHLLTIITTYFRSKHAQLSKSHLTESNPISDSIIIGGIVQKRLFDLVAEICATHGKYKEDIMALDYKTNGFKSDYIHPRFLAKLIRMGDLLDTDNDRFNDTLCQVYGTLPKVSENHYKKHKSITHLLISPRCIEIRANCENHDIYRATRYWFDLLKEENVDFALNWSDIVPNNFTGNAPQIRTLEVLLKGKKISREEIDLKFEFKQKEAFELLEGSNIYSNKLDFLRELIQNALDAIKLQFWRDLKSGIFDAFIDFEGNTNRDYKKLAPFDIDSKVYESYKVEISSSIDDEENVVIEVKDNGIGISSSDLKYIKNPGNSWDKRDEYQDDLENMPLWLKPTGGFGVGLQSCFMMSNKIEIQTKTISGVGKKIELESPKKGKGYFSIEDNLENKKRGTKIIIKISDEKMKGITKFHIGSYVDEYFRTKDPFDNVSEKVELKFIDDYIEDMNIKNLIFKISYKEFETPTSLIKHNFQKFEKNSNIYYAFQDNGMILWENKNAILVFIETNKDLTHDQNCNIDLKFKGIPIRLESRRKISRPLYSLCFLFDFYGFTAKEYLTLNRQSIIKSKEKKIEEMIDENLVRIILEIISLKGENLLFQNDGLKFSFYIDMLNYKVAFKEEEDFKLKIENLNLNLYQLNNNENKFDKFVEKFPNISVITKEDYSLEKDINANIKESDVFIVHQWLQESLFKHYSVEKIKLIKTKEDKSIFYPNYYPGKRIMTFKENNNINKYKTILNIDDSYTKNEFLSGLYYEDSIRTVISGLDDYKDLVVKGSPFGVNLYNPRQVCYNYNYIISPFLKEDIDNFNKENNIDNLILEIKNKPSFEKLVQYVKENNISDNVTIDEIKETYTKLMKDYLEMKLEENNSKKEKE